MTFEVNPAVFENASRNPQNTTAADDFASSANFTQTVSGVEAGTAAHNGEGLAPTTGNSADIANVECLPDVVVTATGSANEYEEGEL